jgi:hypothetical protein
LDPVPGRFEFTATATLEVRVLDPIVVDEREAVEMYASFASIRASATVIDC